MEKLTDNFKNLEGFIHRITFIRGHFKDGEWIDIGLKPQFIHTEGILRKTAIRRYEEELLRRKKRLKQERIIPKFIINLLNLHPYNEYVEIYKTIICLMDILEKDFIDDTDLDNILANAEQFYNTHYNLNNKTEEIDKNSTL